MVSTAPMMVGPGERPNKRRGTALHPYLDHPGTAAIAHRGGSDCGPENSMASFTAAVALGYRYLETDAHLSADGRLIAFHDGELGRVTDRPGRIAELAWDEIRQARLENGEHPPLLTDLFEAFPETRINIDPKGDSAADALVELLPKLDAFDRLCVGSFSGARLARMRAALGKRLCTSMGPTEVFRLRLAGFRIPVGGFPADCAQVPLRWRGIPIIDRAFVQGAHRLGLKVHVWTINDAATMDWLIDLGVDGIMTDQTRLLRDRLARHSLTDKD